MSRAIDFTAKWLEERIGVRQRLSAAIFFSQTLLAADETLMNADGSTL